METDNERNASRAKAILISTPFVLLLGSGLLAIFLLIHTWVPTIIAGVLVLAGWGITVVLRLCTVKFRFSDDAITVLFYPISPMTSKFRRIDIASGKLVRFEVRTTLMGFRKELVLFENFDGEEAAYPPVSIALFTRDDIRELMENLSAYCSDGTNS
jgi:hypothetical protein